MEIGLYGNPFQYSYEDFGCLVTGGTWYKCIWEMLTLYSVSLDISDTFCIKPARINDKPVIKAMFDVGFRDGQLQSIKVVCHFYGLLHLSNLTCCDGKTIDHSVFTQQ